MPSKMRSAGIFMVLMVVALGFARNAPKQNIAPAKLATSKPLKAGALNGRVFGITNDGDLKPARLALLFLFLQFEAEKKAPEQSPALTYLSNYLREFEAGNHEIESDSTLRSAPPEEYKRLLCKRQLLSAHMALSDTLDFLKQHDQMALMREADADEEGNFQFANVAPGQYEVVALGRAGLNDAYWDDNVTINQDETLTLKLSSPTTACVASE